MSDINLLKGEVRESIGKASAKTAEKPMQRRVVPI